MKSEDPYIRTLQRLLFGLAGAYLFIITIKVIEAWITGWPAPGTLINGAGVPLGGDLAAFVNAGRLFEADRLGLYDFARQSRSMEQLLGQGLSDNRHLPFAYPPLVAWVFSLFNALSYQQVYVFGSLVAVVSTILSVGALLQIALRERLSYSKSVLLTVIPVLGYFPFSLNCILGGQLAWVGIVILSLCFIALKRERIALAGVLFSLSYYKPPLFIVLLIGLMFIYGGRFIAGFTAGALFLIVTSIALAGWGTSLEFLKLAQGYRYGETFFVGLHLPPDQGAGVYALLVNLCSDIRIANVTLLLLAITAVVQAARFQRAGVAKELVFSFLVITSLALSIQCINYDLSIALVPCALVLPLCRYQQREALFLLGVAGLLCEWIWRRIPIFNEQYNLSALALIVTSMGLWQMCRAHSRLAPQQKQSRGLTDSCSTATPLGN